MRNRFIHGQVLHWTKYFSLVDGGVSTAVFGILSFLVISMSCLGEEPSTNQTAQSEVSLPKGIETFEATWRIIDETYFDTNFNGISWKAAYQEFRPKAEKAKDHRELLQTIQQMLDRLGSSHTAIFPKEWTDLGTSKTVSTNREPSSVRASISRKSSKKKSTSKNDGNLGFEFQCIKKQCFVTRVIPESSAGIAQVRPGWILNKIEDIPIDDFFDFLDQRKTETDHIQIWSLTNELLKGKEGSEIALEFLDGNNQPVTVDLTYQKETGISSEFGNLPKVYSQYESKKIKPEEEISIGFIRFNNWMSPVAGFFDRSMDEVRDCDGIILDLRGNLGGVATMTMGISGHFFKERVSLGSMKMRGPELQFFTNPRKVNSAGQRVEPFSGPLAILIDGLSASTSEVFAGGMQALKRARIFGQPSPGQVLPSVIDYLPNGDMLIHPVADFVTPTGVRLEGKGVIPDEIIPFSREDLLKAQDSTLSAAVRWIVHQKKQTPIKKENP